MIIATDVDNVWIGPKREPLGKIETSKLSKYLDKGEFPLGSMGPKVQSAINFVQSENQTAIITSLPKVMQALEGNAGTIVHF